jgi:hypothetical protein
MGSETKEEKEMKKQFAKLSKLEQEKAEREYQRMTPGEFDQTMTQAKKRLPAVVPRRKRSVKTAEKKRAA